MKDIGLDENGDLLWQNGDLSWEEADYENIVDLLDAAPGEYKQYPYMGMYVQKYRNAPIDIQTVRRDLRLALGTDNWLPESVTAEINNDGLLVLTPIVKK